MRWNGSTLGKTIRTNTVGGSGLWSLPTQARAQRDGNWAIATSTFDADALAYIRAVEAADGQALESGVVSAINTFVAGLKTDNVWADIEAACILAGARTVAGALTPLKGAAPTNYNFVSSDYLRFGGLRGDASTKYLDSNRANDAAGTQDDFHMCAFNSTILLNAGRETIMGCALHGASGGSYFNSPVGAGAGTRGFVACRTGAVNTGTGITTYSRFMGVNRSASGSFDHVGEQTSATISTASQAPAAGNIYILATNNSGSAAQHDGNVRLMFYSIGTATDLTLIRDRVSTLVDQIRNFQ